MKRALPSPHALTALADGVMVLAALMLVLSVAEFPRP
jgi:hypothetical protein